MQNNKRSADLDNEDTPPIKMPSTSSNTMDNMKFQVEIVHEVIIPFNDFINTFLFEKLFSSQLQLQVCSRNR